MKTLILAVLLTLPALAGAEEAPSMTEVQAMMGLPASFDSFTCGGGTSLEGERVPKWSCTEWSYPSEDGIIVLVFDTKTKLFANLRAVSKEGTTVPYNERQAMLLRFVAVVNEYRARKVTLK
jgi:hypothetical protein